MGLEVSDIGKNSPKREPPLFSGLRKTLFRVSQATTNSLGISSPYLAHRESNSFFHPIFHIGSFPKGSSGLLGVDSIELLGGYSNWTKKLDFLLEKNLLSQTITHSSIPIPFNKEDVLKYIKDNPAICYNMLFNEQTSFPTRDIVEYKEFLITIHGGRNILRRDSIVRLIHRTIPQRIERHLRETNVIARVLNEYKLEHPNLCLFEAKVDGKIIYLFIEGISPGRKIKSTQDDGIISERISNIYLLAGDPPAFQGTLRLQAT